jgi:hypothetical protein
VRGALFVADENVPDRVVEHRVVRGQNGPAGVPENGLYPFMNKTFPDDLGTGALAWHVVQSALLDWYQSN